MHESPSLWMQVYQIITWGFTMSHYWHFYFFRSPIAVESTPRGRIPRAAVLLPKVPTDVLVIPLSMTLGYVLPTALPAIPSFSKVVRINFLAIWQIFPILVGISQFVLSRIARLTYNTKNLSPATARRWLRWTYIYGLALTSAIHVAVLLLIASPTARGWVMPGIPSDALSFRSVFGTTYGLGPPPPVESFHQGTLDLLLMDTYWAVAVTAFCALVLGGLPTITTVFWCLVGALVAGPAGGVLTWFWVRDEKAFKEDSSGKGDKVQ